MLPPAPARPAFNAKVEPALLPVIGARIDIDPSACKVNVFGVAHVIPELTVIFPTPPPVLVVVTETSVAGEISPCPFRESSIAPALTDAVETPELGVKT